MSSDPYLPEDDLALCRPTPTNPLDGKFAVYCSVAVRSKQSNTEMAAAAQVVAEEEQPLPRIYKSKMASSSSARKGKTDLDEAVPEVRSVNGVLHCRIDGEWVPMRPVVASSNNNAEETVNTSGAERAGPEAILADEDDFYQHEFETATPPFRKQASYGGSKKRGSHQGPPLLRDSRGVRPSQLLSPSWNISDRVPPRARGQKRRIPVEDSMAYLSRTALNQAPVMHPADILEMGTVDLGQLSDSFEAVVGVDADELEEELRANFEKVKDVLITHHMPEVATMFKVLLHRDAKRELEIRMLRRQLADKGGASGSGVSGIPGIPMGPIGSSGEPSVDVQPLRESRCVIEPVKDFVRCDLADVLRHVLANSHRMKSTVDIVHKFLRLYLEQSCEPPEAIRTYTYMESDRKSTFEKLPATIVKTLKTAILKALHIEDEYSQEAFWWEAKVDKLLLQIMRMLHRCEFDERTRRFFTTRAAKGKNHPDNITLNDSEDHDN